MTKSAIRAALRNAFGAGKYRITSTGEIHIHGQMPNSIVTGWYLYGWMGDAETIARIEGMDEDEAKAAVLEYLNDNTSVVDEDCNGQILYCSAF